MSNKELLAKIKAEIKRQIKDPQEHCYGVSSINKLRELLDFLDSIESEKPVPADLEEASDEYAEKHGFRVPYDGSDNFYDDVDVKASKEGFIAGAKWQEKKDQEIIELAEDHAFLAGADWQREQGIK